MSRQPTSRWEIEPANTGTIDTGNTTLNVILDNMRTRINDHDALLRRIAQKFDVRGTT